MFLLKSIPAVFMLLGAVFQPPAEVHSVELTEWRTDAGGNGHFYEAVAAPAGITWKDAEAYATAHDGYLATLASKEENAFVFNLVNESDFWMNSPRGYSWGPWLGGTKLANSTAPNNGWGWVHQEGPFTFTNWATLQPDNDNGQEDHLHFYSNAPNSRQPEWNDQSGDKLLQGFVVEYDGNPLPATLPYVALFGVCVVGLIALGSIAYFLFQWRRKPPQPTETEA